MRVVDTVTDREHTLYPVILYSRVPNRRGGGWKNLKTIISGGDWKMTKNVMEKATVSCLLLSCFFEKVRSGNAFSTLLPLVL